jgi:D-psicose/D-tagatose/L-ribulose 3-epimerase
MTFRFRQAICNEVYKDWNFDDACRSIRKAGYTGIEIAHFTLAEDPATVSAGQRREYRRIMADEGVTFVGLHWLMVAPKGLHVTTPDAALRDRSWQHIRHLIDLCADLGTGGVMVFGSPLQRATTGGISRQEATQNFVAGLTSVVPHAVQRGVTILVEPLPSAQCDVIQSLEEAVGIVHDINSPAIKTMFDTHNAVEETTPHAELVERYFDVIRHVHVNEMDGRHCGRGDYDFKPVLATLKLLNYNGWVSLEAFDFSPGAETIANESLRYLEAEIERLPE